MCLLLGSPGSGKTLLLKRLNECSINGSYTNIAGLPTTIPTVGTNLLNVYTSKRQELTIRELGGCMAPIWHNYYQDCEALLFLVDMSNRQQVASACILLLTLLNNDRLAGAYVLLVLNKIDMPGAMSQFEFLSLLRHDDVIRHCTQNVDVLQVSAKTGSGLQQVAKWLQDHVKP